MVTPTSFLNRQKDNYGVTEEFYLVWQMKQDILVIWFCFSAFVT